jgi:hypothetical protein
MLGKIIVGFMNVILNIAAVLILIIGTIAGGAIAANAYESVLMGAILGFIVSFLVVVVYLGVVFLIFEINNNLTAIRKALETK